jgi:hypothetical protein
LTSSIWSISLFPKNPPGLAAPAKAEAFSIGTSS